MGGSTATSYISIEEADALLFNTRYNTTWQGNTEAEKSQHLVSATMWLETMSWAGTRCHPSTDDAALPQALAWPRSGASCDGIEATCGFIPAQIKRATAILAAELTSNPGAINGGGGAAQGTYVKRQKLGSLEVEYDQYDGSSITSCDNCNDPAVITAFPWLKDLLGCWVGGLSGGVGLMLRVRS